MLTIEEKANVVEALRRRDAGDHEGSLRLLLVVAHNNKGEPRIQYLVGHTYWNLGDIANATRYFKSATSLDTENEAASLCLFHCLWDQGCKVEAIDEAKRFLSVADSQDYRHIIAEINATD
jgi:hypothetical protein